MIQMAMMPARMLCGRWQCLLC